MMFHGIFFWYANRRYNKISCKNCHRIDFSLELSRDSGIFDYFSPSFTASKIWQRWRMVHFLYIAWTWTNSATNLLNSRFYHIIKCAHKNRFSLWMKWTESVYCFSEVLEWLCPIWFIIHYSLLTLLSERELQIFWVKGKNEKHMSLKIVK